MSRDKELTEIEVASLAEDLMEICLRELDDPRLHIRLKPVTPTPAIIQVARDTIELAIKAFTNETK